MNLLYPKVLLEIMINPEKQTIYFIGASLIIVSIIIGIVLMSKINLAKLGNRIGAVFSLIAIVFTMWAYDILSLFDVWIAILVGLMIGLFMSSKVKMIQMPQMVALLNGFGGAASCIAGSITLILSGTDANHFSSTTSALAIFVGGVTFSGSMIAAGKLHKIITQKAKQLQKHGLWTVLTLFLSILLVIVLGFSLLTARVSNIFLIIILIIASILFGILFAIRVGGADMPITISLLNSLSGLSGSIAGLAIANPLLVAIGCIVGASGLILTQIMCKSMNRRLVVVLMGQTSVSSNKSSTPIVKTSTKIKTNDCLTKTEKSTAETIATYDYESWLEKAESVVIVPGYGMALAQAQLEVKQIMLKMEEDGKNVVFAIHPVAGRMPGHMNVLLAEVDIPYDKMHEMDEINATFKEIDLVIVIGANDVINPAANTAEGTPIYGMPILNVEEAKHILIFNFDKKPGYAGVDNPLYHADYTHVQIIEGDAKQTLKQVLI